MGGWGGWEGGGSAFVVGVGGCGKGMCFVMCEAWKPRLLLGSEHYLCAANNHVRLKTLCRCFLFFSWKLCAHCPIKAKIYSASSTGKNKGFKEVWDEFSLGANCTGFEKAGKSVCLLASVLSIYFQENGHMFTVNGIPRQFYGALCAVSADNPASAACGRFKESAAAYRFCRHCMATSTDSSTKFKEQEFELRSADLHEQHLTEMEGEEDSSTLSTEYGINRRSVLDDLQYFKVASGSLLPDIMHDVLEGVLQYEAKLMLIQFLLHDHYFTIDQLNIQIESIELGHAEAKNCPCPISMSTITSTSDHLLKQNGKLSLSTCMCTNVYILYYYSSKSDVVIRTPSSCYDWPLGA